MDAGTRAAGKTIAELLDELSAEWLASRAADDEAEQRRLHPAVAKLVGTMSGGDPPRERISTVFTTDFADFQTYRIAGRQHFRIVPDAALRIFTLLAKQNLGLRHHPMAQPDL